jgi:hypothetical protein
MLFTNQEIVVKVLTVVWNWYIRHYKKNDQVLKMDDHSIDPCVEKMIVHGVNYKGRFVGKLNSQWLVCTL